MVQYLVSGHNCLHLTSELDGVLYLRRRSASGESIVTLAVTLCVSAALVLAVKVMRCIQCSLVLEVLG